MAVMDRVDGRGHWWAAWKFFKVHYMHRCLSTCRSAIVRGRGPWRGERKHVG